MAQGDDSKKSGMLDKLKRRDLSGILNDAARSSNAPERPTRDPTASSGLARPFARIGCESDSAETQAREPKFANGNAALVRRRLKARI